MTPEDNEIFCDLCGNIIEGLPFEIKEIDPDNEQPVIHFQVCENCFEDFIND